MRNRCTLDSIDGALFSLMCYTNDMSTCSMNVIENKHVVFSCFLLKAGARERERERGGIGDGRVAKVSANCT